MSDFLVCVGFFGLLYDDNEHEKKREVDLEALGSEARNPVGARRSWHIGGLMVAAKVLSSRRIFCAVLSALKHLSSLWHFPCPPIGQDSGC